MKSVLTAPLVSVVVPVLNAEATVTHLLEGLRKQDLSGSIEYIFVDGLSRDATQKRITESGLTQLQVLVCTGGLAASRAMGVRRAAGKYVAFIDGDCVPPAHWLSAMIQTLEEAHRTDSSIVGVGGSNVALHSGNTLQQAISLMKDTFLGSYNSVYGRSFDQVRRVTHIATVNSVFLREVLTQDIFNHRLSFSGEDIFMTWTLRKKGYGFVYCPQGTVGHTLRSTLSAWMRNMFQYGRGRMYMMLYAPEMMLRSPLYFGPIALVILLILLFWPPLTVYIAILLGIYLLCIVFSTLQTTWRSKMYFLFPLLIVIFVLTHVSYGLGQIYQTILQPWPYDKKR